MNEFAFEPMPERVHTETLRLFGQTVQFTKHGDMCNGIFQFNGLTHLLSWETIGYKRDLYIDGVAINTRVYCDITDICFMQALVSLHKLTAWQQCELFHDWFETSTTEHITYEVAGIEFYAETSMDDTAWRYVTEDYMTEDDNQCYHTSRWFNGHDYKPCLHHFRHWINSTIEYKENYND